MEWFLGAVGLPTLEAWHRLLLPDLPKQPPASVTHAEPESDERASNGPSTRVGHPTSPWIVELVRAVSAGRPVSRVEVLKARIVVAVSSAIDRDQGGIDPAVVAALERELRVPPVESVPPHPERLAREPGSETSKPGVATHPGRPAKARPHRPTAKDGPGVATDPGRPAEARPHRPTAKDGPGVATDPGRPAEARPHRPTAKDGPGVATDPRAPHQGATAPADGERRPRSRDRPWAPRRGATAPADGERRPRGRDRPSAPRPSATAPANGDIRLGRRPAASCGDCGKKSPQGRRGSVRAAVSDARRTSRGSGTWMRSTRCSGRRSCRVLRPYSRPRWPTRCWALPSVAGGATRPMPRPRPFSPGSTSRPLTLRSWNSRTSRRFSAALDLVIVDALARGHEAGQPLLLREIAASGWFLVEAEGVFPIAHSGIATACSPRLIASSGPYSSFPPKASPATC